MPRTRLYSFCALSFASIAAGTASHAAAALSGTVSDAAGTAVHIVGHSSNGASSSAADVVNSSGAYTFPNLAAGSYTIAPRDANHVFTPNSLFASLESSAVGGLNFTGTETTSPTYKIAGTLSGAVTAGAIITLNGANVGAVGTDRGGSYSFSGLTAGTYTVSASLAGHAFSASRTVTLTDVDSNENGFNATATPGGSDVVITSVGSMPTATVGKAYSSSALKSISGGEGAYHYQTGPYSTGTPPLGMTVGANGVLSGTPRATGTSTFLLCASDNYGRVSVACAKTTLSVAAVSSTVAPTAPPVTTPPVTTPPVTTPPVTTPPVTTSGSVSWVYYNGVFDWPGDFDYAATANYADTSGGPLSGAHDIKIVSSAWGGWLPYALNWNFNSKPYTKLTFSLKPTASNQTWQVYFVKVGDVPVGIDVNVSKYGPAPVAGKWATYTIPLEDLGVLGTSIYKFAIQDQSGLSNNTWYIDNVGFE